jgi:hypothetical protein
LVSEGWAPHYQIFDLHVQTPIHNTMHNLCQITAGKAQVDMKPAFHLSVSYPRDADESAPTP